MAKNEPQSYGSGKEWQSGDVGEQVNRLKGPPNSQHADFYESRHDRDDDVANSVSPVQAAENVQPEGVPTGEETPVQKVATAPGGAKREGYFKKREYDDSSS